MLRSSKVTSQVGQKRSLTCRRHARMPMATQAHKVKQITLKPREPAGTTNPGKSSYSLYTSSEFKSSIPV